MIKSHILIVAIGVGLLTGCGNSGTRPAEPFAFEQDLALLEEHTDVIVLKSGERRVAVVPQYQGRVMTSTTDVRSNTSFGWLNDEAIKKGVLPPDERKGTLEEHIHVFGGEERLWLGPEGGQFSIFFKPGDPFEFEHWVTPPSIDTLPFTLVSQSDSEARFSHESELLNYSGTQFSIRIERTVRLINTDKIDELLDLRLSGETQFVAYETENLLVNTGDQSWTRDSGTLSIWLLGMYKPSPGTTVVIPFNKGSQEQLGPVVNDAYFGKVPPDYLTVKPPVIFFKGDGTLRSKIGISPIRSKGIAGSYDAEGNVLNLVIYNVPKQHEGYVNSMWEIQEQPFDGDAINAYNDGSPGPGLEPLGPFYELETSSPAAALKPGESIRHIQQTIHLTGSEKSLDAIALKTLGVSINEIRTALP